MRSRPVVLDLFRERVEFPDLKRKVDAMAMRWRPDVVLIEDKASGQSLIQELRNSRLPVFPVKVDSDKLSRAIAITPMVEAGKVFLPADPPWLADFLEEVSSFPAAPHDDQIDSLSQALNYARECSDGILQFMRHQSLLSTFERTGNLGVAAAAVNMPIEEAQRLLAERKDEDDWSKGYWEAYAEAGAALTGAGSCARCRRSSRAPSASSRPRA